MTVYLLTTGDGEDGNEWAVVGIFSSGEAAEAYRDGHNTCHPKWGMITNPIEAWELDPAFDPTNYPPDPVKT